MTQTASRLQRAAVVTLFALCSSCAGHVPPRDLPAEAVWGPFKFQALQAAVDSAPSLRVSITVRNTSDRTVRMTYGHCALVVRLYHTDTSGTSPAWDQNRFQHVVPRATPWRGGRVCQLYEVLLDLKPGELASPKEFKMAMPTQWILGDSLPDASYRVAATLQFDEDSVHFELGRVALRKAAP